jgi:hypothetical protein
MQKQKSYRYLTAAALLTLVACSSEPTDASDVWFLSTHGRVVMEDGSAVANALVHAMWFEDHECDKGLVTDETARTDAVGQYSILLEGREREGCLGVSVTPDLASGLSRSYTVVQVVDLQANDFESFFMLEWIIPSSSGSVAGHGAP